MKNKDLITIHEAISKLDIGNAKFRYFIGKNKKLIMSEIAYLEGSLVTSEDFKRYDIARIALCVKHSNKDENGGPKIINNQYEITDMKKFSKEFAKLQDTYKEAIMEQNRNLDDYNKLLEEETAIELALVSEDNIADDIPQAVMDLLLEYNMIK